MADANIRAVITADDRASAALGRFGNKVNRVQRAALNLGKRLAKLSAIAAAGFGVAAVKSAIEFESTFAGVRKTVEATEKEFAQLSDNFREIAKTTPVATSELNRIGELAGQLGVSGVDNLTKFTKTIADIAVTTNLTEEAAATSFARIANIMQEPLENVDRMGASVVDLGNNFATTESEITEFATRIAGAGKTAGLTTSDIFGIGAAFSSVGVQAERGGTAVSKALFAMANAVSNGGDQLSQFADVAGLTVKEFKTLFEKDAARAFDKFILGLEENGIKATGLLEELELSDQRLMQSFISVAGAGGIMSNAINTASDAFAENTALAEEAEKRYKTTQSQLKILKNRFNDIFITVGSRVLPVINQAATLVGDRLEPAFQKLSRFFKEQLQPRFKVLIEEATLFFEEIIKPNIPLIRDTLVGAFLLFIDTLSALMQFIRENKNVLTGLAAAFIGIKTAMFIGNAVKAFNLALASARAAMALAATGAGTVATAIAAIPTAIIIGFAVAGFTLVMNQIDKLNQALDGLEESHKNVQVAQDQRIAAIDKAFREGRIDEAERKRQMKDVFSARALGGPVTSGTPFLVGERGPELFVPSNQGRIVPNNQITTNNSPTVNLNVNIGMFSGSPMERRKIAQTLFNDLQDIARQKGTSVTKMMGA